MMDSSSDKPLKPCWLPQLGDRSSVPTSNPLPTGGGSVTLRSLPSVRTLALAAVLATGAFLTVAATALANTSQFSIMQDDRLFVNSGPAIQTQALNDLQALGPHTIHTVVNWRNLVPNPGSRSRPAGF